MRRSWWGADGSEFWHQSLWSMATWQRVPVPQGAQPVPEVVPSVPRKSKVFVRTMTRGEESPRYETW